MAPLSQMACTCTKWKNLPEERKTEPVWVVAHVLHHNLLRHRPPFTVDRLALLAECSVSEAQAVLDEAVRLEWFRRQEPSPSVKAKLDQLVAPPERRAYYLSPVKAK